MPDLCAVSCQVNDQQNRPVEGAVVSAVLSAMDVHLGYVAPTTVEATTNALGKAVLNLWPNQLGATATFYKIRIATPSGRVLRTNAVVPDAPDAQLHLISELPPFEGKTLARVALDEVVGAAVIVGEKTTAAISALDASIASAQATAVALATAIDAAGQPADPATVQQIIQNLRGPAGPKGDRGSAGSTGAKGDKGDRGETGAKGEPGAASGGSGGVGPTGATGPKGDKGDRGDAGSQGEAGEPGEIGPQGYQGAAGAEGPKGATGAEGLIGPRGLQGVPGLNGLTGPRGEVGALGPRGDLGSQGPQGLQGETGDKGDRGDKGERGDAGLQGSQGLKGDTGAQGVKGDIGAQGVKGDTGAQGVQGAVGETGAAGPQGSTGLAGAAGAKGDKGDTGDQGAIGPQGLAGEKGDTGLQGDTGAAGAQGAKGDAGAARFKRVSWANPVGSSSTVAQAGLMLVATGTAGSTTVVATNAHQMMRRVYYSVAVAAVTATAGVRNVSGQWFRGAQGSKFGGFDFLCRFGPSIGAAANTTRRGFCGFRAGNVPSDVDPSTIQNILGVGCDTADTTYHIMHKDNLGVVTKVDTGISKSAADFTEVYELEMRCIPGGDVTFKFTNLTTDEVFTHTASTNLPAATALLTPQLWYSVGGTSSVIGASLMHLSIDTDY